ncbi:MAG: 3-oxoacyl-[acyl-carrier-protein] reductase [Candidatus Cloacimonadota bacterium]|nr:3-oxoacyl-[acyl-carrier-protein] reductase [Candidatus Cloacimonadota bacterium]
MKRLKDKVAIVTGAARGIGFSIAEEFAKEGANVIIIDLNQKDIDAAAKQIDAEKTIVKGFAADVTNEKEIKTIFNDVYKEFGQIDILVNNAGITRDNLLMRMKGADWDLVMKVNLKGAFICTQKVIRYMMKKKSGSIINMSSVIGLIGNAGQANYAASKGGLIAFTKSTSKEVASRNIRANAIAPGFIETDMTKKLSDEVIKEYEKVIPLNRMGKPKDIANLCKFLASDEAEYITGQTINVDGGLVM